MDRWLTIEVFDGATSADSWRWAHGDALTEAALTNGAQFWEWPQHRWGVVLLLEFADEQARDDFRYLPAIQAALDAVPDPVGGLLIYPGRGGGSGSRVPRRPRPQPASGAGARPEPTEERFIRLPDSRIGAP